MFGRGVITKHVYYVIQTLNPGIATLDNISYVANGPYDPEFALGGHQPRGFDQMTNLFREYVVIGSKIRVRFSATDTQAANVNYTVGIKLSHTPTALPNMESFQENPYTKTRWMEGNRGVTMVSKFSAKKFFPGVKPLTDEGQTALAFNANPTRGAYFIVFAGGTDVVNDPAPIAIGVTITYIIAWFRNEDPGPS